jgi:hypothetical protein
VKSDPDYVRQRNMLIPAALKFADKKFGFVNDGSPEDNEAWSAKWNSAFHGEMNRLWKEFSERR